jgi:hypothetical protein
MRFPRLLPGFTAVWFLLSCIPIFAQATATINGRIVDQGEAVLPGATVTVTNVTTGAVRTTFTNDTGLYSVPALENGTYTIRAELSGFAPAERTGVALLTGSTSTVNITLSVGAVQETLTVTGASPLVDTTKAVISGSIRQQEVVQLPMLNRTVGAMMTLLPGIREGQPTGSTRTTANYVSIGGDAGRTSVMVVDGLDNKEDQCSGSLIEYSLEGIEEFKVMTSGFGPEYRGSAAMVLATKAGTNQMHGSAFLFGRNQDLVATDYFAKPENHGLGKQPFNREQFGGSFGGPLVHDRAWYFGSYERVNQTFNLARSATVQKEISLLVPLNIAVDPTPNITQPSHNNLSQFKLNLQPSQNHGFFARYAGQFLANDNTIAPTQASVVGYQYNTLYHQKTWITSAGWNWVISPKMVSQLVGGYTYYNQLALYPPSDGFDCVNRADLCTSYSLVFPTVRTGFPQWSPARDSGNEKIQIKEDLTVQLGRHSFKFGGDYIKNPTFGGYCDSCQQNTINWFDDPSIITTNKTKYPEGFQTPGAVRQINIVTPGRVHADYTGTNVWAAGAYAQDDFRLSKKITLNLGLRFDHFDYLSLDQYQNNRTVQILTAIGNKYAGYPTIHPDISPTAGVAWDVGGDGKNILRASYSSAYVSPTSNSLFYPNIQSKPQLNVVQTLVNTSVGVGQAANFIYGVSPIPTQPGAATQYLPGASTLTNFWNPDLKDPVLYHTHGGYSHAFDERRSVSVDFTHLLGRQLWRFGDINPFLPVDPSNPSSPLVRPLAAGTLRVYGDPRLLGTTFMTSSIGESRYDGLDVHFEQRYARSAFQVNYTLAWANGYGGSAEVVTNVATYPQHANADGGDFFAPGEWGPTPYDERHRVSVAGVFSLPWGMNVAPAISAATARPYNNYRGLCPCGSNAVIIGGIGALYALDANGNPVGPNAARGKALINANARLTKDLVVGGQKKLSFFAEFYNIFNRANFGNMYGTFQGTATYNQPINYLGGSGATSTVPISFQVQLGARYSF